MKVETKKSAIVGTGICLLIFLFTFLFQIFGPKEENINIWLPENNYELQNVNPKNEIVLFPQSDMVDDTGMSMSVSMQDFKDFIKANKNYVVSVLIKHYYFGPSHIRDSEIVYKINFQAGNSSFAIKASTLLCSDMWYVSEPMKIDRDMRIISIKHNRDWFSPFFLLSGGLVIAIAIAIVLWPSTKKLDNTDNRA